MKTEAGNIKFALGIAFFPVLLMNGLYYMMPFDAVNVYEYLGGNELMSYQLLNIFTGGAVMPLIALIAGYMLNHYRDCGIPDLAKILLSVFAIGVLQAIFIFAFDFLPGLALMALVGSLFLKAKWYIPLISAAVLYGFHMMVNVLPGFFESIGSPRDKVYSAIQTVNEYTSVYTNSDYFAMISQNIEIFSHNITGGMYASVFTVLPWILLGIALGKLNIARLLRMNQILAVALFITLAGGGLGLKMIQVVTVGTYSGTLIAEHFGGPVLGIGYFILLVFVWGIIPGRAGNLFILLGERSLTMYILSNIILIFVFYGIGFRAYGEMSIAAMTGLMLVLYIVLLITAVVFKKFRISGIESLFTNNSDKLEKK